MAVTLKTPEEIEKMRRAGQLVRRVLQRLGELVEPGVQTRDLDAEAERMTIEAGADCLFKGVPGRYGAGPFPGAICVSINEQVVHGIPSSRRIADGDIVSIDFGVKLDGWCGDAAETFIVGDVHEDVRRLVGVTKNALSFVERLARPGEVWSTVARAMQEYIEGEGFSVVREFVGHGIGRNMHEDLKIPNFVSPELEAKDIVLEEGMTVAIEPMVNLGSHKVELAADRWTVLTKDRKPSAHYEHTMAITSAGVDLLTDGRPAPAGGAREAG